MIFPFKRKGFPYKSLYLVFGFYFCIPHILRIRLYSQQLLRGMRIVIGVDLSSNIYIYIYCRDSFLGLNTRNIALGGKHFPSY